MQPSIFLQRTKEEMTCGIVNIPLTKPAQVYFRVKYDDYKNTVYNIFESLNIPFYRVDNPYTESSMFTSNDKLDSKTLKLIFRNYRTLRPKLISDWRYLFWEIDNHEQNNLAFVLSIYQQLELPVYVHKTMRGYHFFSIKPILEIQWNNAITALRNTNTSYPPITLRINPNKYVGEYEIFRDGFVVMPKQHSDTLQLRTWIESCAFSKIQEQYMLVWYNIDKTQELREE